MALLYACEVMTDLEQIEALGCGCSIDKVRDIYGDDVLALIPEAASDAVAIATGKRVTGRCTVVVRPCSDGVCGCTRRCTCCNIDGVVLPGFDITIDEVKLDGAVLAPEMYALIDGRKLVPTDQTMSWPGYQVLTKADSEPGTFSITYTQGQLPFLATMAATEIGCDLMAALTPGGKAKLPAKAVAAIMDQVSIQLDPSLLPAFPWMERLMAVYPSGPPPVIWSPEIQGRYTLHTVR